MFIKFGYFLESISATTNPFAKSRLKFLTSYAKSKESSHLAISLGTGP